MDLAGSSLGNYQIIEELGRGGMAVVYRAYQPSLNRYVAIKVLPPQLSFDQQFVDRFQREARAAANLRHPNIVVIHDVAHHDDTYYIVMEYLEGRTLKELVEQTGPLPPQRAAHIVEQVAAALDYAHQRGFVHRDVKPANIFVSEGDRVTLTDFGIAKAASETEHLTRTGTLMGTPEYMSPEQAEGGSVDHRTDLYALGVVLYQMLVGRVPFRGTTPHAVLHDVIYEAPPPPRQLNPSLSPALEQVVLKAIAKQPDDRYQRGAELVKDLRRALTEPKPKPVVAPPPQAAKPARQGRSPVGWILGGIAAVVLLLLAAVLLLGGNNPETTPVPATTAAPAQETPAPIATTSEPPAAPSETPISDTPVAIASDTPSPTTPAVAPTDTALPPTDTPLAPTPTAAARFGRLAFSSNRHGNPEIYVLDLAGGGLQRLTNNNTSDWLPDWSPDGHQIAFTSQRTGSYDLWVIDSDGNNAANWVATGSWDEYARWAPDGQRLSLSTTAVTAGIENSEIFIRETNGTLRRLTTSQAEDQWADWAPDNRLAYTEGFKGDSNWDIYTIRADGSNRNLWLGGPACDVQPTWSPDGQWIAFLRIPGDTNGNGGIDFEDAGDVWVGRASGGELRQLTSGLWATTPTWSPDGQWLAFTWLQDSNNNGRSDGNDAADIWAVPASGGEAVPLLTSPHRDGDPSWTW